jgi:hypothetical protein
VAANCSVSRKRTVREACKQFVESRRDLLAILMAARRCRPSRGTLALRPLPAIGRNPQGMRDRRVAGPFLHDAGSQTF